MWCAEAITNSEGEIGKGFFEVAFELGFIYEKFAAATQVAGS